jgi:hypothetical protein
MIKFGEVGEIVEKERESSPFCHPGNGSKD